MVSYQYLPSLTHLKLITEKSLLFISYIAKLGGREDNGRKHYLVIKPKMCLWGGNKTAPERTAWVNGEFLWVSYSARDSVM